MRRYSFLDIILNKQFLDDTPISNFLFERILNKSKEHTIKNKKSHIFITGLARSGTTILLNKLFQSSSNTSLLYKNMPFILFPELANLFSKSFYQKESKKIHRYHNDGIEINHNSPECFDEIFFG